jgi:lysophospholipase L1-like esterase
MKLVRLLIIIAVLQIVADAQTITVYLAGDSTMAEKTAEKRPETGWGEYLQIYFDEKRVKIDNRARNGRSTKSFIDEGHWQKIVDDLKPGDYVLIQFGHNDSKKEDPKRYAEAKTDYITNLKRFASEVRKKSANPVILSPVVRRRFNEKLEFYDTHGEYPSAARQAATEAKVPFIDMHGKSEALLRSFGAERSKKLFLILAEGEHPNYPKGSDDNTHFSAYGAEQIARLAVEGFKETMIGLAKLLIRKLKVKNS